MKLITTLAAAVLMAASGTVAVAQTGGSAGSGQGAGGAPAAPQLDTSRPNAAPAPVLRRSDEMAPMRQSNVSSRVITKKKKHSMDRTYR
jgi:hypothetical protein